MGPEFYGGSGDMDQAVDIWALGLMIHQMIFGLHPFDGRDQREVIRRVINEPYQIPAAPQISDECADMLTRCLMKNPTQRINI